MADTLQPKQITIRRKLPHKKPKTLLNTKKTQKNTKNYEKHYLQMVIINEKNPLFNEVKKEAKQKANDILKKYEQLQTKYRLNDLIPSN